MEKKAPRSLVEMKLRKCVTRHFGMRVALVVFGYDGSDLLLLIRKSAKKKAWSLPYQVPDLDQSLQVTAEDLYKTLLPPMESSIQQIYTFGESYFRDRRWITTAYSTIIPITRDTRKPADTADWQPVNRRPMLSRLEDQMINKSLDALRQKARYEPIGIFMLPPEFTLQELQKMYESLLAQPISKQSFRKKMWESDILIPLEETITERGRSQPKGLYRFNKKKYYELKRKGFFLDL